MKYNNSKKGVIVLSVLGCFGLSSVVYVMNKSPRNLSDEALLSIIKNDQKGFESYIAAGGSVNSILKVEDGSFTVGELTVKYERAGFVRFANEQKLAFESDLKADYDTHTIAVSKNNPEILGLLLENQKKLDRTYTNGWSLLHLASNECSYKVISSLHKAGYNWNLKAKNGSTPLTVAADAGCLQALSYWKENGADFKAKDGRGMTALSILNTKKDAALMAFADSFVSKRAPASIGAGEAAEPNFYKKRLIPKDNLASRADLIEPEDRPDDANETAEYSEFSD